jgi:hypothetical protein
MSSFRAALSRKPGVGTSLESSEAIGARLDELERKLERLRAFYESFFLGVERRPPHVARQELNRLMLETQQSSIRNAALRFRFQALSQRWTLLTTYWNRTLREIESGSYRRDLQKAYRRIAARGEPLTEAEAAALGVPIGRAKAFVAQQNRRWGSDPKTPSAAPTHDPPLAARSTSTPAAPPATEPAMEPIVAARVAVAGAGRAARAGDERFAQAADVHDDLAVVCQAYAEAHARMALAGPPPTAERIRDKILPHLHRLRAKHPTARLDVTVVAQDGRLILRAKPVS